MPVLAGLARQTAESDGENRRSIETEVVASDNPRLSRQGGLSSESSSSVLHWLVAVSIGSHGSVE
jgi:hypothetical protein